MLRTDDAERRRGDTEARRAATALQRLERQSGSTARDWLELQLYAYVKFWGDKRFEAALLGFRENERVSFSEGTRNLMSTARAVRKILDKPSLRERAAAAAPPCEPPPRKPNPTAPASKTVAADTLADAGDAQPLPEHLGVKPPSAKAKAARTTTATSTKAIAKPGRQVDGNPFLRVDMLPARHGDSLWIEYGRGKGKPSRVLIDCGPKGSDDELRRRIDALPPEEREFELFILSHIDDDHIGAAITLLKDARQLKLRFGDVWFNGWRHLSEHLNAAQGEAFSALLEREGLPWNASVGGAALVREVDTLPEFTLPGGMKLTLLSPTPDRLKALARSWKREVGDLAGKAEAGSAYLGRVPSSSEDVDALAAMPFDSDTTAPNGSSIAVLAEFGGHSLLLGADAHAPVLEEAVRLLCRQRGVETLKIDAFKLPHHGSQNNLSATLLAQLRCPHYLVSTSGARFNHPDREALARVIVHGRKTGQPATLWFNYRAEEPLNAVWDKAALKARYGYATVYPDEGAAFTRFALPAR